MADDHSTIGNIGHVGEQVVDEPGRGLLHHEPVHPQRAGTHRGAQPGGAELEATGETLGDLVGRAGEQRPQLLAHVGVGLCCEPLLRRHQYILAHNRLLSSSSGRGPTCEITSAAAIAPRRAHSSRGRSRV